MSLVGSLDDLGLGDIFQIISLSGKSGVLLLRSDRGEGRIVFQAGELRGAWLKGEPTDLRELLLKRQVVPSQELERLFESARGRHVPFETVLCSEGGLSQDRLDELRRDQIEEVVLRMFRWSHGEFSFESQTEKDASRADELALHRGINPQFLALEGTRLQDEGAACGGDGLETSLDDPSLAAESSLAAAEPTSESRSEVLGGAEAPSEASGNEPAMTPVVVIDPDLAVLERAKRALSSEFPRVHIFQRSELGNERIRQYLARAETPTLLLSERAPADPMSGAQDWREILQRLKASVPHMPIFLLCDDAPAGSAPLPGVESVLVIPRAAGDAAGFAALLRDELRRWRERSMSGEESVSSAARDGLPAQR
jgi:hypothetical protein